jgi:hypothetical protein
MEQIENGCYWYCKGFPQKKDEKMKADAIEINYKRYNPTPEQCSRQDMIMRQARSLAKIIVDQTPQSEEQSLALRKVQEAVFWAKCSISLNEGIPGLN